MSDLISQITSDLQKQIEAFKPELEIRDVGEVVEAGDGIARVRGLADVRSQELVEFSDGTKGIAFNLEKDTVGVIIMGEYSGVEEGMEVRSTGRIASVPVGEPLVGRVVNALGEPIDGKGPIKSSLFRPIERIAAGVVDRKDVDNPVQTGLKAIDAMIPIGRGQRELIIGDRQTGKTAIAIDTIINQKGKDLMCIYVAIGQKKAAIARTVATLERFGAMEYTTVVVSALAVPALDFAASRGTLTITKCNAPTPTVIIPEVIHGWPVSSIGDGAFIGCTGLMSLTVPSSVTSIGSSAFACCVGVTKVVIPNTWIRRM